MSDTNKPTPPNWEELEQKGWRKNAKDVPASLSNDDSGIRSKIATYHWRFGHRLKAIKDKIQNDPMFAAHFSKDPKKQSMHENAAIDYLKKLPIIIDFVALPKGGNNAKYVTSDGEIRLGEEFKKNASKPSKSLDFEWQSHGLTCYASHKYTREGGGSQDNQYREQKKLLVNFLHCEDRNIVLFAICDGAYYDDRRMEELRNQTRSNPPYSFAVHIEEVSDKLDIFNKYEERKIVK